MKFWAKRKMVPVDPSKRKLFTMVLSWGNEQITIGPDDVVEGEQFQQFVEAGMLEPHDLVAAKKVEEKLRAENPVPETVLRSFKPVEKEKPVPAEEPKGEYGLPHGAELPPVEPEPVVDAKTTTKKVGKRK